MPRPATSPNTSRQMRTPAPSNALEALARFATREAFELVRSAARAPRVARHFTRLDPFGHTQTGAEAFGRALQGLALWLLHRSDGPARARGGTARKQEPAEGLAEESALYGNLDYRYALDRFALRAVHLLGLSDKDRWAGQMLLVRTLADPIRERVREALDGDLSRSGPGERFGPDTLAEPA